jgi:two-component system, LytTR family, response regulator
MRNTVIRDGGTSNDMVIPTIRTVIADDEGLALKKLRILLSSESGVSVLTECRDGKQALAAVETYKPDLLFLDVQMPGLDGFEVLGQIPEDRMPIVVFTTAYDRYAIRAFEAHALDYLLKPFNQARLHRALERARKELLKAHEEGVKTRILDLLNATKPESKPFQRLVIRTAGRVVFLDLNEIDWIEAAANYVRIHTGKDSYLLREGIGHMSAKLDPAHFVRIHRSIVVNVNRIRELQPCDNGEYIAVLRNGKELSCSRGCRSELQRLIDSGV